MTHAQLPLHVFLDQVHGHVTGTFDHHLAVVLPGLQSQLSQGLELRELRFVIRIGCGSGSQSVTERKGNVVGFHDFADLVEPGVEEAFFMVRQAPFGHDRSPPAYDARNTFGRERDISK